MSKVKDFISKLKADKESKHKFHTSPMRYLSNLTADLGNKTPPADFYRITERITASIPNKAETVLKVLLRSSTRIC